MRPVALSKAPENCFSKTLPAKETLHFRTCSPFNKTNLPNKLSNFGNFLTPPHEFQRCFGKHPNLSISFTSVTSWTTSKRASRNACGICEVKEQHSKIATGSRSRFLNVCVSYIIARVLLKNIHFLSKMRNVAEESCCNTVICNVECKITALLKRLK